MTDLAVRILTDLGAVALALPLWLAALRFVVKKWIETTFDKELERHKNELAQLSDRLRHSLQRELIQAELRSKKIHDLYPELFAKFMACSSAVLNAYRVNSEGREHVRREAFNTYAATHNFRVLSRVFCSAQVDAQALKLDELMREGLRKLADPAFLKELQPQVNAETDKLVAIMAEELKPQAVDAPALAKPSATPKSPEP